MLHATHGATAQPLTGADREDPERRPVRLLVPTARRDDWYLTPQATLLASDLGINRHTTNDELKQLAASSGDTRATLAEITQLRDGLATPRDVKEAREWGFIVRANEYENTEELDDDPTKNLGWWWVYDPYRTESRFERRARYLADQRLVDTKGLARLYCRAYPTIRNLKINTALARDVVADKPGARAAATQKFLSQNPGYSESHAAAAALASARRFVLRGAPLPAARGGQSDLFTVSSGLNAARVGTRLDEWYEFAEVLQSGRPRGARTRNKTKTPA